MEATQQTADCPNLRDLAGKRYRLAHDTGRKAHADDDPWLIVVDCQLGTIGVWGAGLLVACTKRRGPTVAKLASLPGARIAQDGDDGANVVLPENQFKAATKIMRPRTRRVLTPEQRQRLTNMGRDNLARMNQTHSDGPENRQAGHPRENRAPVSSASPVRSKGSGINVSPEASR